MREREREREERERERVREKRGGGEFFNSFCAIAIESDIPSLIDEGHHLKWRLELTKL